jgi:hypothetical protein
MEAGDEQRLAHIATLGTLCGTSSYLAMFGTTRIRADPKSLEAIFSDSLLARNLRISNLVGAKMLYWL